MDFYYLCIYRMVHRSILCSIGPGNFCKPGIFKWTVLSNLRMWSGDCCSCFDSAKGQPADIICGFFLTDFHFGIHYRIYSGKSVSQQVVGLQQQAIQSAWICVFEIFHLLGTCMYIHYGCDSSDHLQGHHHDPSHSGGCAAQHCHGGFCC